MHMLACCLLRFLIHNTFVTCLTYLSRIPLGVVCICCYRVSSLKTALVHIYVVENFLVCANITYVLLSSFLNKIFLMCANIIFVLFKQFFLHIISAKLSFLYCRHCTLWLTNIIKLYFYS